MARLSDALDIAEPGGRTGGLGTKPKPLDVRSMMEGQMSKVKQSAQESRRSTRNTQRRQLAEWENNWETSIDDGFNNENPQLTQKKKELSSPTGTSNKIPSNNLVDFVLSFTSLTNANPGLFCAGPCGLATKLRIVAAPC